MSSHFRIGYRWTAPDDPAIPEAPPSRRPCLILTDGWERAQAVAARDALPQLEAEPDDETATYRRFELPAGATAELKSRDDERMQITLTGTRPSLGVEVGLYNDLVRRSRDRSSIRSETDPVDEAPRPPQVQSLEQDTYADFDAAQGMIDRHIDLINHLREKNRPRRGGWEGTLTAYSVRSAARVNSAWRRVGGRSEPRMALIVRLARELSATIDSVCSRPRRILRRERMLQPIGTVQEIDAGCLRWLSRQPGRTSIEKAGARQRILGIARFEDVDTPENRLAGDFLDRAIVAAMEYLREHREFGDHDRVKDVRRFHRLLVRLQRTSDVSHLPPPTGGMQPNYVLQFDERYRQVWDAWLALVRRRQEQDQAWRWRHRIFAEQALLLAIDVLRRSSTRSPALRSDLHVRGEQSAGAFLAPDGEIGSWYPRADSMRNELDLVWGPQIHRHPQIDPRLRRLAPDLVVIRRSENGIALFPIWTALSFAAVHRNDSEIRDLQQRLDDLALTCELRGVYLLPLSHGSRDDASTTIEFGSNLRAHRVDLAMRPTLGFDSLLQWGIGT
jgi:hypothetical protein